MSLVNDALKRATQAQKNLPPVPVVHLPLRPIEPAKPKKGMGLVLPATLLTIIVAALLSLRSSKPVERNRPTSEPPSTPAATPAPKSALMELAPGPLVVSAREVPPASAPTPLPVAVVPLRLQAVFYSPPNPSAIISGKTVHVGDSFRDLQVVAIGSSSALLVNGSQTNFLTLE